MGGRVIFVGAGFESAIWGNENAMGAGVNIGYNLNVAQRFWVTYAVRSQRMRGSYFKPNMFVSTFNYTELIMITHQIL